WAVAAPARPIGPKATRDSPPAAAKVRIMTANSCATGLTPFVGRGSPTSEVDRQALLLPVAIAGRFGPSRSAVLDGRRLGGGGGAAFGGLQQGAAGRLVERALRRGVRHVGVE